MPCSTSCGATRRGGLRYRTYKLADGSGFVHGASIDTDDGSNPLVALESFRRFQQGLRVRCSELPVSVELLPLDSDEPARPRHG
jgi:hypothetical protein